MNLPSFIYKYDAGPLTETELRLGKIEVGNCRLAVQAYLYYCHHTFLKPSQVLLPNGYFDTGEFVTKDNIIDFRKYKIGDVIYAERLVDKDGKKVEKKDNEDKIVGLHSAIYIGKNNIFHATMFEGRTCVWNVEKFVKYYKIVAVKRILRK